MSICSSKDVPELSKQGDLPRDIHRVYIEHTKGIWLRDNIEEKEIELWFNGKFQASWNNNVLMYPDRDAFIHGDVVCAMLAGVLDIGKRERSNEIKALING